MIDIENKVDVEKLLDSIKDIKNGRVLKFVKMYFYDGLTGDEIAAKSNENPSELGNLHKYGRDYLIKGVSYTTVHADIKLGISMMNKVA